MWKKMLFITGGVAVAVALPMGALALTTSDETTNDAVSTVIAAEASVLQAVPAQDATYEPRRLRVHAETGPPDGVEPVQLRIHRSDAVQAQGGNTSTERGTCDGQRNASQQPDGTNTFRQHQANGQGQAQSQGQTRGNVNTPMGDCTDGCDHDLGQMGSGPRGPARNSG